jgi:magnesium-transporting ATPase (P-type)
MQETREQKSVPDWHVLDVNAVLEAQQSSLQGLDANEAQARLQSHGPNRLPEPPRRSALTRFLLQFHNVLIYVLLAAAVVTALLDHVMDTWVILAVVLINAAVGYIQEGKAEKAMEAIKQMLAPNAAVIRNGERSTVPGEQLVPGDIVLLEAGDRVPADLRILQAHGLQVQEAILTGESVPVQKQVQPVKAESALGDRICLAFSGTLVTSGQGKGIVVATGSATEIGRISGLLSTVEVLTTPLVKQMDVFARWLTVLILIISAVLLVYGFFVEHYEFTDMFMIVVGLAVAAIPEGLPAVLTITLAIGVQGMAKRNAIVRRLPAIETLGSVSVICTDKTGTLTRNEMMVSSVLTMEALLEVSGTGYAPTGYISCDGREIEPDANVVLAELALAASLCNDAEINEKEGHWQVEGDPMEGALLALGGKAGLDPRDIRKQWTRTDAIPFDAKHRFMATLNHNHEHAAFIFVKGAPERLLDMCSGQRANSGEVATLDRTYWQERAEFIASQGQRVLAFAVKPMPVEHTVLQHEDVEQGMILLGMTGLIDPPRPEAITAVADCHSAGIRVKMITGDHAGTAAAIGRQIGLMNSDKVLTGVELDTMDEARLAREVLETDIFARTSPEHKLKLVMALQSHGKTVAMTGDGVNDAPALKRADAGIAMGRKGSEAAKEASELVLADDNFASIAAAVKEGRTVYDNLTKVITWTLPTNGGEASTIMVALLLGMTLPITAIQILWVNLVTAGTLGIALAFELPESQVMKRPPRPRNQPILTGELIWYVLLVSFLFVCGVFGMNAYAMDQGYSIEMARTIAVNTLVVMEIFSLFFIRNFHETDFRWDLVKGTPIVWMAVLLVSVLQLAFTYMPFMQGVFSTEALSLKDLLLIFTVGVILYVILEIEKQLRLRSIRSRIDEV